MEGNDAGLSPISFEFINVTGGSGRERRWNSYVARAHAAKINRQNYKTQAGSRRSKHPQSLAILPKTSASDSTVQELSTEDERSSEDSRGNVSKQNLNKTVRQYPRTHSWTSDPAPPTPMDTADTVPTPRSISPSYGAFVIDTFDWNSQPLSAKVGRYLLKVSWPARSGKEVTRMWWTEFCQTPIIYHVAHIASAVHHDLLAGETSWSSDPEILMHKTNTIRMVNEQLTRLESLDHAAIDRLIFAVCTLSRHEIEAKHLEPGEILLFTPHMPHANGVKPLGRLTLSPAARAMLVQLVQTQGGLEKLHIAGLGDILALHVHPFLYCSVEIANSF